MSTKPLWREMLDRHTSFAHADDGERASLYALLDERDDLAKKWEVASASALAITRLTKRPEATIGGFPVVTVVEAVERVVAERDQLAAACDIFKGRIQALEMERDEAREQRNQAQMTWDDEHDAKLRAQSARNLADAASASLRERVKALEDALGECREAHIEGSSPCAGPDSCGMLQRIDARCVQLLDDTRPAGASRSPAAPRGPDETQEAVRDDCHHSPQWRGPGDGRRDGSRSSRGGEDSRRSRRRAARGAAVAPPHPEGQLPRVEHRRMGRASLPPHQEDTMTLKAVTRQLTGTPRIHHAYVYDDNRPIRGCTHAHGDRGVSGAITAQQCAERMLREELERKALEWPAPNAIPIGVRIGLGTGPREPSGCRLWMGMLHKGRPYLTYDGYHTTVARLILGLSKGDGRQACHTCDTPSCVEPRHLYAGTAATNVNDMVARNRHHLKRRTHCKHGHEFDERNTIRRPSGRRGCRECVNRSARQRRADAVLKGAE